MEKQLDFVAIDVETANSNEDICQIGICIVRNGEKQKPMSWLVQPPGNHYGQMQMNVHHITPDKTKNASSFEEVWQEVSPYLVGQTLVAHNHHTEIRVLNQHFKNYDILPMGINMNILCTCKMHGGKGLEACCQAYGISFEGHHDAGFDAECCAQFYLNHQNGVAFDESLIKDIKSKNRGFRKEEGLSGDDYKVDITEADPNSPFLRRKVVITGTFSIISRKELGALLKKKLGADVDSSITKKTNFVFIGQDPGWEKMPKLDKLIHDGYNIRKLYESDIQAILNGDWEGYHMEGDMKKNLDFTYEHFVQHRVVFEGGNNILARKELYLGGGLAGDRDCFAQITGNLGACGDYAIYPETNLCVLSDSTLQKLQLGEKDETIRYIQDYYNGGRSTTFELSFISEGDILRFVKERVESIDDMSAGYYYKRYMGEIGKEE